MDCAVPTCNGTRTACPTGQLTKYKCRNKRNQQKGNYYLRQRYT